MNYLSKLLVLLLLYSSVSAEEMKRCATSEMNNRVFEEYPESLEYKERMDSLIQAYFKNNQTNNQRRAEPTLVIPIVFHVIHNYGAENISDEQIYDALEILNEDFRKRNADTSIVINDFKSIIADANIEFRMATKDPQGNCTNGIDRIQSKRTYFANDDSKLNPWPRDYYLNVWIVNSIGVDGNVAGYAYKPPAAEGIRGLVDGILILHNYIGSLGTGSPGRSRALTHEIGHYLNLDHTWGGTNQPGVACGDDGILDTPITAGWSSCNLNGSNCNPGIIENVQNFMEYSYCSRMFTEGQKAVMRIALNNPIASRRNLWQTSTHARTGIDENILSANTCPPIADFNTPIKMACVGDQINFTDFSWRGTIDTWEWTFSNATPAVSNDQNPSVVFNSPGWQKVTLTVENSLGKGEKTIDQYIYITDEVSAFSRNFEEDFEDGSKFYDEWIVRNYNSNDSRWRVTNQAAFSGMYSLYLNNSEENISDMDEVISPSYDVANAPTAKLNFRYSYASKAEVSGDITDTLSIFYSINCGRTWTRMFRKYGLDLLTVGNFTNSFMPDDEDMWEELEIDIPTAALSSNNVKFKFRFSNESKANNIYIDNINLAKAYDYTSISAIESNMELTVFPVPNNGNFDVKIELENSGEAQIELLDLSGKKMMIKNQKLSIGSNIVSVNQYLSSGLYILTVSMNGITVSKKISIL